MREAFYPEIYSWAYKTGMRIKQSGNGVKLLEQLIYYIKNEKHLDRFLDRLNEKLIEYSLSNKVDIQASLTSLLKNLGREQYSNYAMRLSILGGLYDALVTKVEGGDVDG